MLVLRRRLYESGASKLSCHPPASNVRVIGLEIRPCEDLQQRKFFFHVENERGYLNFF